MDELVAIERATHWHRLKALVLDSVSSPITRRVYNLGLDEFIAWFAEEPRPAGFTKATVTWRCSASPLETARCARSGAGRNCSRCAPKTSGGGALRLEP